MTLTTITTFTTIATITTFTTISNIITLTQQNVANVVNVANVAIVVNVANLVNVVNCYNCCKIRFIGHNSGGTQQYYQAGDTRATRTLIVKMSYTFLHMFYTFGIDGSYETFIILIFVQTCSDLD